MAIIDWRKEGTMAVLTMDNGKNLQNLEFATRMLEVLDEVEADAEIRALVITSSDEKNFSQGVDVSWLWARMGAGANEAIQSFMYAMNDVFRRLLSLPVPAIAAINGHAYGNGAILSCACDFRFMRADRGFFCFPEVNVGIPLLPGMTAWVKKAVPEHLFIEMLLTGERKAAPELEEHNVIRKACPDAESLMSEALGFAGTFDKKRGIVAELKKRKHKAIFDVMDGEDPVYIDSMQLMVAD